MAASDCIYLAGRVTCPFAGLGARAANASNRLVVDRPATATVDGDRITLYDDRDCPPRTVIADLVWLATAGAARFTIHLEVTKTGRAWAVDLHTHEPPHMAREAIAYEPFEIATSSGEVLVNRAMLARVVAKVPLRRRLAAALTTVRDHDSACLVDRSIGIGAGGHGKFLVRARLTPLAPAPRGTLVEMLRDGAWELSLEALTVRWLPELVQRDLVLFGLDELPLLHEVRARGLRVHQTLGFRLTPTGGELRLDDAVAPFPDAHEVARAYLEFHMLGGMIAAAAGGDAT